MTDDTRQDPSNRPGLDDPASDDLDYSGNIIEQNVIEVQELLGLRSAVENYQAQVQAAGRDGLDPVARAIMQVNLRHVGMRYGSAYGLESFSADGIPSQEDFTETLKGIGSKIMELINKLIAKAKEYGARIMSGIEGVVAKAEELLKRKPGRKEAPSTEDHGDNGQVTISSPGILFADGVFCIDDCRAEQDVVKFFVGTWPKYAIEQINRSKRMLAEYDVETGNSENFEANADFIGNHQTIVDGIKGKILPGNKVVAFQHVALGPYLEDANAKDAPDSHTYAVRTFAEIQGTLRKNIATMNALGEMFNAEARIYDEMGTLSKAVGELENRRGETVWKSAKEDLDIISNMMLDLVVKLKPSYDPIVSYLGKVGQARNAACLQELDATR